MQQIGQLDYDDLIDLKFKLQTIQYSLQKENQGIMIFYHAKISQLYEQIAEKDSALSELQKRLEASQIRCNTLQWHLTQKNSIIDELTTKLQSIQKNLNQNFRDYSKKSEQEYPLRMINRCLTQKSISVLPKRINISEYFIRLKQDNKFTMNSQIEKQSKNSTQATVLAENSEQIIKGNNQKKSERKIEIGKFKVYRSEIKENKKDGQNGLHCKVMESISESKIKRFLAQKAKEITPFLSKNN